MTPAFLLLNNIFIKHCTFPECYDIIKKIRTILQTGEIYMKLKELIKAAAAVITSAAVIVSGGVFAEADDSIAHDPNRDVQTEGVGNPFGYGDRNTPEDATTEEMRTINHAMTVQEVKYALYKEIDEHWDLLSVRLGQTEREMVYALFLGIGTRESTLGGNGDGADIETAYSDGFGVSPAHAYGTLQTAVTAFADCDPSFMPEDNVPELYQYSFTESNFYDAIISNHMGIRKILHFVEIAINDEGLTGYQVVRGALKGHNTGWVTYTGEDDGYYKNYPDEVIALARWYYEEGHLYDNVFTWTGAQAADYCREGDVWAWWGDGEPSMAEVPAASDALIGDVNLDGTISVTDAVLLQGFILSAKKLEEPAMKAADVSADGCVNILDLSGLKSLLIKKQV